jgi:uncharacterized protein with PIN domain
VALFAFGRTIHCRCGARVGALARARDAGGDAPRFIADAMLGRLSRWLRILGFDTAYEAHIADADLVRRALLEDRAIVTRDRALPEEWRVSQVAVLTADEPLSQLRELAQRFPLAARAHPFTRCSRCNARLARVERAALPGGVPERVLRERDDFAVCPDCGRVYWQGSHTERMRRVLEAALGPLPAAP